MARWIASRWQTLASILKQELLTPANESYKANVAKIHLYLTLRRNAFVTHPSPLDAIKYDWSKEKGSGCLTPKFVTFNTLQALGEMLKLIKLSYEQQWTAMYII